MSNSKINITEINYEYTCLKCNKTFSVGYKSLWYRKKNGSTMCKKCSHVKNSGSLKEGNIPWNKGMIGYQKGHPAYVRMFGRNNPSWKGGITPLNTKIRNSKEYAEWRNKIFIRDKYTCAICGNVGGTIHADHIKPFSKYVELRFDLSNGRTLCISCHKTTDSYAGKVHSYGV
jgi:DNA-directed RNA polymerase subunit RPC12/RpoP